MSKVPVLLRRELNAYFASALGYLVLLFFLVVMGVTFSVIVNYLNHRTTQFTATGIMFGMFWVPCLFIVPAITMRLLAEEKRSGTIEMLMTAPVTDFEVVFAKYLGAVALYAMMWGLTFLYVLTLRHFAGTPAALDFGPILSGYVGVLLVGQFLIAVGLLSSSATRSQVSAALMCFAIIFLFLLGLNWLGMLVQGGPVNRIVRFLSAFEHMDDFSRGIIDLRPVALYVSGTVLSLFVATRLLESRKWR
jgi:ABC-2 type transport system permease protein